MKKAFFILGIAALLWSCSETNGTDPDPTPTTACDSIPATYNANVKPILSTKCAGCHTVGSEAGINVSTYQNAKQAASQSIFLAAIRHESGARPMPDGGPKLSDADIKTLECWIQNGFPEN